MDQNRKRWPVEELPVDSVPPATQPKASALVGGKGNGRQAAMRIGGGGVKFPFVKPLVPKPEVTGRDSIEV